jgi:hypothetical protein
MYAVAVSGASREMNLRISRKSSCDWVLQTIFIEYLHSQVGS